MRDAYITCIKRIMCVTSIHKIPVSASEFPENLEALFAAKAPKRRSRANLAPQDCSKRRSRANLHALWPPKMPFQDHHNVYFSEADPKLLQMQPNCSAQIVLDSTELIQNFCKCSPTAVPK